MRRDTLLTLLIILGLVAGVLFGQFVLFDPANPIDDTHWTKRAGELVLIRPLMLLIIPLIFVSVVVGVTSIGDPARLGLIGGATLLYYLITMLVAVILGTSLVVTFRPGDLPPDVRESLVSTASGEYDESPVGKQFDDGNGGDQTTLGDAWLNVVQQLVPTNVVDEMANGRTLGVIVFSILLGLALAAGGGRTEPAVRFFEAMFDAMLRLVTWVIWLTPIGVALLVSYTVGAIGLSALKGPLGQYILTVMAGLAVHGFVVLPLVLFLLTRRNSLAFLWQVRKAVLTAFGTASSSATLPVSIEAAVLEGGCSKRAANFVLPLGSTINMDGTALYEAVAVVFLFQLYGIELGFGELVIVVVTATLAAIGAAGIPSAGLITMVIVIAAVNTSLAGRGVAALPISAIGVIIGIDRLIDMCRTAVNVWGDLVGARVITQVAPDESAVAATASS